MGGVMEQEAAAPAAKPAMCWLGRPLTELTREELIAAVEWLGRDAHRRMQDELRTAHFAVDCFRAAMGVK